MGRRSCVRWRGPRRGWAWSVVIPGRASWGRADSWREAKNAVLLAKAKVNDGTNLKRSNRICRRQCRLGTSGLLLALAAPILVLHLGATARLVLLALLLGALSDLA